MATYKKGILGQFNGKVGAVIGSSWKNISYMRSLPKKSSKEPTQKQIEHRLKFSLVSNFFKPITPLLKIGYLAVKGNLSTYNAAFAQHLSKAVIGSYPDFEIDYAQVIFSKGELPGVSGVSMTALPDAALALTWMDNSSGLALATDSAVILVFEPTTHSFLVVDQLVSRADGAYMLDLPTHFVGKTIAVWMAFFAADGKMVSTSTYVGTTTVLS